MTFGYMSYLPYAVSCHISCINLVEKFVVVYVKAKEHDAQYVVIDVMWMHAHDQGHPT